MRTRHPSFRILVLLAALLPFTLPAMDVKDVVELKKADLGEEVILAQAKAEHAKLSLKTEDFKALKAAGCSDKLIIALMTGFETPAPAAPVETATVIAPAAPAAEPVPAATLDAALELEMLDDTALDVALNPQTYTIQVARAGMLGGGVGQSLRLSGGVRQSVKVPAGRYTVQWDEDDQSYSVNLAAELPTKLIFSQASTKMYDAIYLSIFRGETRVDGGRLHMLKIKSTAFDRPEPAPAKTQAAARPAVIETPTVSTEEQPATVVRTQTVYVPAPVVYREPVYVTTPTYYCPPPVRYVYTRTYTPCNVPTYRPVCRPTYSYPSYCGTARVTTTFGHRTYASLGVGCNGLSLGIGGRDGFVRLNLGGCR